jgi:putative membrane protein
MQPLSLYFKTRRNVVLISILILFYTVGSIGTQLVAYRGYFLSLSPYNLLLSFAVAVLAIETKTKAQLIFFLISYILSMTAEWIGTSTGYLFGTYYYGKNLGATIFGVPLVIGLNWWILLVGASSISSYMRMKPLATALFGAVLMTLLDRVMEPVSIKSDFWHWKNEQIPFYNYVCWFILSFLLLLIQQRLIKPETNKVHAVLFVIIFLFFCFQTLM